MLQNLPSESEYIACNHCASRERDFVFRKKGYDLVRCKSCKLAYIANPPDEATLSAHYSAMSGYHDGIRDPASEEFAEHHRIARQHMSVVRKYADTGRLIDIGCAAGHFLDLARQSGFEATGLEYSDDSAIFAREHFGLDVATGTTADHARTGPDAYDIITAFDVIEHVPDPSADLVEMRQLLKPGGLLILSTPDIDGLFPRVSERFARSIGYWPHPEPPGHLYQFSQATLTAMCQKAGFTTIGSHHFSISLSYNFGKPATLMRYPKMLAYALAFAPVAWLGEKMGKGDWLYLVLRKS